MGMGKYTENVVYGIRPAATFLRRVVLREGYVEP